MGKFILLVLVLVIIGMIILSNCSYSKLRSDFIRETKAALEQETKKDVVTAKQLERLPVLLQRFYKQAGYIGKVSPIHMTFDCKGADFCMNQGEPFIKIDYTEEVFTRCTRLAFIDSKMHGIPFQGLDRFVNRKGSMTGVLAKLIPLFQVTGTEMDQAAFVTWLSEAAIFLPEVALSEQIIWSDETENTVTATMTIEECTVSVTFTFNDEGLVTKAWTKERFLTEKDHTFSSTPWYIGFEDYKQMDGRYLPCSVKSVWDFPEGEYVYFVSHHAVINFE